MKCWRRIRSCPMITRLHDMTKLDETIEKAEENEKIIEESLKTSQDK